MVKAVAIMPCLDMKDGRVVKGVHFEELRDAGDPAECARVYGEAGADELAMLDIAATVEKRATWVEIVRRVADVCTLPFTVGGGIGDALTAEAVLQAGANKISVASAAFKNPKLVDELVKRFGEATVTVAIDVDRNATLPSGYEVYVDGGRTATGVDALDHAKRMADFGVQTLLPTSKATDGALTGFDLPLIRLFAQHTPATIVASGGAGKMEDFLDAAEAGATVLLAASVFHFGTIKIPELKAFLQGKGVPLRMPPA